MKKITRNILVISGIAILSSCITNEMKNCCKKTVQEVYEHEGLVVGNTRITFDELEIIEMKNTLEDVLEWQEYDRERGETGMGSYEEGWGSNYWLTVMKDELCNKLECNE